MCATKYFFWGLLVYSGSAVSDTLIILNWEEYLSPKVIEMWEEKTGHKVREVYFDNDEARDSMLIRAEQKGIDIAVVDELGAYLFGGSGNFVAARDYLPVDVGKDIDPFWRARCGEYTVPYLWGTFGIVYRSDIVKTPPTSWQDILRPSDAMAGHISILKDSVDTFAPALFARGLPLNTRNFDHLKLAFEDTKAMMNKVLTLEYPITYVSSEDSDDLYMGVAYSGDQWAMNSIVGKDIWRYTVPKEGTLLWVDCFAVLKASPKKAIAYDFINFISQARVAALNSEALSVATTIPNAKALQSDSITQNASIYPPEGVIKKGHYYEPADPESFQLRNRMASALLKIYESK